MAKVANTHAKAAKLVMDKLGDNFTVEVYFLKGLEELVKIEST
jgi:hypothetical protein